METEYNGWTNRETWATNLWIDNEFGLYERVNEMAKEIFESEDKFKTSTMATQLEELFDELFDMESLFANRELITMMSDIGSLYRVNWGEIAQSKLEEVGNTMGEGKQLMKTYLFNVQTTIEIVADSEEQAVELIGTDKAIIRDQDILLVEESN